MADPAKHLPVNGGTLISDLRSLFSVLKARRTMAFLYGFMFAFVVFTVFLALNPSPNSGAPWFANIFTGSTAGGAGTGSSSSDSSRSQFSSIFSYFFPPNNSSAQKIYTLSSPPPLVETDFSRSRDPTFSSPTVDKELPGLENHTQTASDSKKPELSMKNRTWVGLSNNASSSPVVKNQTQSSENSHESKFSQLNQTAVGTPEKSIVKNQTESSESKVSQLNQTVVGNPENPVVKNQTQSSESKVPQLNQTVIATAENQPANKSVRAPKESSSEVKTSGKGGVSNNTASFSSKQSNETKSGVSVKPAKGDSIESLMKCDFFDGKWVKDESYQLYYKPGSCSLIDEQFNCVLNGRPDKDYMKFKWKPKGCNLPRLDGKRMLEMLRGKRLVFVGDSLNRNMWESLVCILRNSAKDPSKVFEAHGRHQFRGEASYDFIFKDYGFSIEFFVSPFLVQEWEVTDKNGTKKETLRLDLVGRSADQYKNADIIVFNTGHWWTHDKTSLGQDYYQEGSHVYKELNVLEAFRKATTTWGRWVDSNINPKKSLVFFRGYSESHFSGGQWNSGGQCDSETLPIMNEKYLRPYPPKMTVLEKVMRGMKTHVTYLNVTKMTDFRKDGHPSIYRKQNLSKEERRSPLRFQDCSHWCLPGVPDVWNELLYAELLVKLSQKQQQQQKRP